MQKHNKKIEIIHFIAPYCSNPTAIFNQLCHNRPATLLFESSEINKKSNLQSIILVDTAIRITAIGKIVELKAITQNGASILPLLDYVLPKEVILYKSFNYRKLIFPKINNILDEDTRLRSLSIFDCLRFLVKILQNPKDISNSIFFGGLFSYDLVTEFEFLPYLKKGSNCPDYCFYLAEILIFLDHEKKTSTLKGILFENNNTEKQRIQNRLKKILNILEKNPTSIPCHKIKKEIPNCNLNDEEYKKIIFRIKEFIRKGEIFQVVLSRFFMIPCPFPLASYHALKKTNPSPYMFFMQDYDFILFGASPESSLKYDIHNRKIEIYPIAGTRTRARKKDGSLNRDLDSRIELEMLSDKKELSEHLMLVDLARNDLAKICKPGSRYVSNLIRVDRYSVVMHLVSKVIGILKSDLDMFHAYRACMNMGTLSGAPKIRAMEIIAKEEKRKRGSYGGSIGYFTADGSLDTCIIIRSAYIENGIAKIQAGAGIVIDSIPQSEADESRNKAKAVLNAINNAYSFRELF